jgi:DNA-binding CsgD family transcriptional regulator
MKASDPISVIEAAYCLDAGDNWLKLVADSAVRAFGFEQGVVATVFDASKAWVQLGQIELRGVSPAVAGMLLDRPSDTPREQFAAFLRVPRVGSVLNEPLTEPLYRADFEAHGIGDVFAVNAGDPTGLGCMLLFPDRVRKYPPRRLHTWRCLAAHIAAGNRLRRKLERVLQEQLSPTSTAEAVLSRNGRVEHAESAAKGRAARAALQEALVRIERARARLQSPEEATELWSGLVSGRWSIVETFDRDGKEYYLAHRNDPELAPERALTQRERQVLAYANLGQSNKLIAYSLGLSPSSVATLLTRARRKLGAEAVRRLVRPSGQAH